jgi:hypothetical protein
LDLGFLFYTSDQLYRERWDMDINGEIRGYMARNMGREEFIKYVATAIEHQLKEWDGNYEVFLMKLKKYEFMVSNGEKYYHVIISENELDSLQKSSPFELDRKVWTELQKQGLEVIRGVGNYIETILQ